MDLDDKEHDAQCPEHQEHSEKVDAKPLADPITGGGKEHHTYGDRDSDDRRHMKRYRKTEHTEPEQQKWQTPTEGTLGTPPDLDRSVHGFGSFEYPIRFFG